MCTSQHLKQRREGTVTVITFADSRILDESQIQEIGSALTELVERGHQKILLNFTHVEFISSSIIGKFIALERLMTSRQGRLVLCEICHEIYQGGFESTKLNKLFNIQSTETEGLTAAAA